MGNKFIGVLWDLDGTIIDTEAIHYEAWKETFKALDVPFSKKTQQATFGMNAAGIIQYHLGDILSDIELFDIINSKERLFRDLAEGQVKLFQDVGKWLLYFQEKKIKQAIASSAPLLNIELLVVNLGIENFFVELISGDELPPKPSPDIFFIAANRIDVTPSQCLVIEDSTSGVNAAKAAGMKCLAVTFTHEKEELYRADLIIESFSENPEESMQLMFSP